MAGESRAFGHSKVDGYGFERSEDFDFKTYEEFMASYLSVLTRRAQRWKDFNVRDHPDTVAAKSRKIKRFCRKGIPSEFRTEVWMTTSGADERMQSDPGLYSRLVSEPMEDSNPVQTAINLDIHRTFPENINFANTTDTNGLQKPLRRVLAAIAKNNTNVGYCQGLNFVTGLLLLIVKDENKVFWLMDTLINNILPVNMRASAGTDKTKDDNCIATLQTSHPINIASLRYHQQEFYVPDMLALRIEQEVLGEVVRWKVPEVAAHMDSLGLQWCLVGMKWYICLFADVVPVETALRIWDCLFFEGAKILHRVALTMVILNKDKILATKTFSEAVDVFRQIVASPQILDCHKFMKDIFQLTGSFPRSKILQFREECQKKIK